MGKSDYVIGQKVGVSMVTDLSTGRVGAPLTCGKIRLCDWPEGRCFHGNRPKYRESRSPFNLWRNQTT